MNKLSGSRSSLLVNVPALAALLLLGVLAAFFRQQVLAAVLLLVFLFAGASRLWGMASARGLTVSASPAVSGLFPGEKADLEISLSNGKLLPLVWLELFFPLPPSLCLVPEETRKAEEWEVPELKEAGYSTEQVGEIRIPGLLWYESRTVKTRWKAQRRSVCTTAGWMLRTGDGFGLTQTERSVCADRPQRIAVYPRRVDVLPDLFLRSLWNADTGARGVLEDPTVIRSAREYQTGDPARRINWRLIARGLPLMVNCYEEILPRSVHFLFDGESFSGPQKHREEMEEALSILGSELLRLQEARVSCGLSLCRGTGGPAVNLFPPCELPVLLTALAAYEPEEDLWNPELERFVPRKPFFDAPPLWESAQKVGRFYYIVYDTKALTGRTLLNRLGCTTTTVLTWEESGPYQDFETVGLRSLKKGGQAHG